MGVFRDTGLVHIWECDRLMATERALTADEAEGTHPLWALRGAIREGPFDAFGTTKTLCAHPIRAGFPISRETVEARTDGHLSISAAHPLRTSPWPGAASAAVAILTILRAEEGLDALILTAFTDLPWRWAGAVADRDPIAHVAEIPIGTGISSTSSATEIPLWVVEADLPWDTIKVLFTGCANRSMCDPQGEDRSEHGGECKMQRSRSLEREEERGLHYDFPCERAVIKGGGPTHT